MEKKYYEVVVRVVTTELYKVYADSEEQAEDLVHHGNGDFKDVIDVEEFEVIEVEEIED